VGVISATLKPAC